MAVAVGPGPMFGKRIELFKLFGFAVRVDLSWFLLLALVVWTLAAAWFPAQYPDLSSSSYLWMGVLGALGLFLSIVVHELAHSLVARRFEMPMHGITLFIFGGVAEMKDEPPSAKAEFLVAVVGPLTSVAISGLMWALAKVPALPVLLAGTFAYLAMINIVLAVFNTIPAFPLDGGRILRSILWSKHGDIGRATRVTARLGMAFGMGLIFLAVFSVFTGNLVGGIWWFLIGMFLRAAAQGSYQQLLLRRALSGESVERFMTRDPITVPASTKIRDLVEDYVYQHHHKMFPVTRNGELVGLITTEDIKRLAREDWDDTTVDEALQRDPADYAISPETDAMDALARMKKNGVTRLLVTDGGELRGVLCLRDLLDFFALKVELEVDGALAPEARPPESEQVPLLQR